MSGGHFDYIDGRINQTAEDVEYEIQRNNVKDEYGRAPEFSQETLEKFREGVDTLRRAAAMIRCVDYLVSCDDSEESFHRRWAEEVPGASSTQA